MLSSLQEDTQRVAKAINNKKKGTGIPYSQKYFIYSH